jgi:hypothetical protein
MPNQKPAIWHKKLCEQGCTAPPLFFFRRRLAPRSQSAHKALTEQCLKFAAVHLVHRDMSNHLPACTAAPHMLRSAGTIRRRTK